MFSYPQSVLIVIVCLAIFLFWLLGELLPKGCIPTAYKMFRFCLYPVHKLNQQMFKRKGFLWMCLIWGSIAALSASVIVLGSENDITFKAKVVACISVPPALIWWLRSFIRKRRQRKYYLPGRRR